MNTVVTDPDGEELEEVETEDEMEGVEAVVVIADEELLLAVTGLPVDEDEKDDVEELLVEVEDSDEDIAVVKMVSVEVETVLYGDGGP